MNTTDTLRFAKNATDYVIQVEKPDTPPPVAGWPAVLFMDGDDQFPSALTAYRKLREQKRIPELLLVGVGYGASYRDPKNRRGRDYTPTPHPDEPTSGGAAVFMEFLERVLWPHLAGNFPVREDIRGLAGHSLGSLLGLYALCEDVPFFHRILASAPSIWWDERSILRLLAERRRRRADLSANLFLCIGENDTDSMTGDFKLLERQLENLPFEGLSVSQQRFRGRDHYNVIAEAFEAGLASLYGSA